MPRGYLLEPGTDPANPRPAARIDVRISWTIEGNLKDVVGFNLALTTSTGSPLNATTVKQFLFLQNPAARNFIFEKQPVGEYVGWVQTVAPGGDSKWMSSAAVTVSDDGQPTVRGTDDRNVQAFCEDFRSASLPTGFAITNGSHNLTASPGSMRINGSSPSVDADIFWDVEPWIDAYLSPEAKKNGRPVIIIRAKWDSGMTLMSGFLYVELKTSGGTILQTSKPIVDDGYFHDYRIQVGDEITLAGANSATLRIYSDVLSTSGAGKYMWLDAVAVGFDNFDMALDGNVDKGITSWNQFDSATGGGYFLVSPIRQPGDDLGSQIVLDENGMYYLRNESGQLITEMPFKYARVVRVDRVLHGEFLTWNDSQLSPALTPPVSINKARFILERIGSPILGAAPAAYPVRDWCEIGHVSTSGFRLGFLTFDGGTPGLYVVSGPWSQSSQSKSAMTLSTDSAILTTETADAWNYLTDDLPADFSEKYYRAVVWISITMPTAAKSNGSFYYADLTFTAHKGMAAPNVGTNRMDMVTDSYNRTISGVTARAYTDGQKHKFPIVFTLVAGTEATYQYQNFKVDWTAQALESGGSAPTLVEIDRIELSYMDNPGVGLSTLEGSFKLTYLETF